MNIFNDTQSYQCAKGACEKFEVGVCYFTPCTASEYYTSSLYVIISIEIVLLSVINYTICSLFDNKKLKK